MDSLITAFILLVISGIAALLKKKAKSEEAANPPPANRSGQSRPAAPTQPQRRSTSWEEELRRLLADEQPAAPPPVVRPPAPVAPNPPPIVKIPAPTINPPRRPMVEPRVVPIPVPSVEIGAGQQASLKQSRQAYERTNQIATTKSANISRVNAEPAKLTAAVVGKPPSGEVAQVVSLFKNARTARQAVLASVILGPPIALEQTPTLF